MTVRKFNNAVKKIEQRFPDLKLGERFTSTTDGEVCLHQTFEGECDDFEFFRSLGLVLSHQHFFTANPIEGVKSEFAKRKLPKFINVVEGTIPPSECWRENTVLYNSTMCAWSLNDVDTEPAKGYLVFQYNGGFGRSSDTEFIKWLIATKQVPW